MIATIAAQQIISLRRQRVFTALLASLVAMTALAGVIGWMSRDTIVRVYDEAVRLLAAQGQAAPANPFDLKPTLSLLSNMSIYIPLIGALLALVVGHLSLADDQSNGLGRLIFSRQVPRTSYVLGKILSVAAVLAAVLVASFAVSVMALLAVNRAAPTFGDLGRLALFYGLSWLYLLVFALVGMLTVLVTRRRSMALLAAMGVWLVVTFAVPQLTSGLRPTTSLNPIIDPVSTSQPFFSVTAKARPISISEQYKAASGQILETAPGEPGAATARRVFSLMASALGLAGATSILVKRHDYSKGASDG